MHRIIFLLSLLMVISICNAQDIVFPDSVPALTDKENTNKKVKKVNYNFELGTGYMGSKYFSGAFTTFSPRATYNFSPRFNVEAGSVLMLNNISFNSNSSYGKLFNGMLPGNQSLVFANGQYAINNKITLTGAAFKSINMSGNTKNTSFFNDLKGLNLGVNYKISENIQIGAQIEYSNRYNNLMNNSLFNNFSNPADLMLPNW